MPYIVTTWGPASFAAHCEGYEQEVAARRAVATLEEAREYIRCGHLTGFTAQALMDFDQLSSSGGTISCYDGRVITVERVPFNLRADAAWKPEEAA